MILINKLFGGKSQKSINMNTTSSKNYEVVEREGYSFTSSVDITNSDIVKACIRPKVKAIGKLQPSHFLNDKHVNDKNLMFLLSEPNEIDSLQTLLEKLVTQLSLNNNAYAIIERDNNGNALSITPVLSNSASMKKSNNGNYFIEFQMKDGVSKTVPYADVIHLRQDHNNLEYFGTSPSLALQSLLETIEISDKSVDEAVKSSTKLRWIMKFHTQLRPEDQKALTEQFKEDYLSMENNGGVGASDSSYDLEQIKQQAYVPDAQIHKDKVKRVYDYFGVNESIVSNDYDENQWSAYYEAEIEPILIQLSNEFTRKLFNKVERMKGNHIIFSATGLQYASMESKIKLVELVDRGLLVPNEVRKILNLPKVDGGEVPIRRLDTVPITDERHNGKGGEVNDKQDNGEA